VASPTLSPEEKERILKTLEVDKEFRYALMGLLGFSEILDRITKLEERFTKLEERVSKLEERMLKLEERFADLEKRFLELENRFARIEEELRETRRVVVIIAHRFGVISEESFRQAMKYVVEDVLGVAKVEKWVYRDDDGFVYGYPSIVEVDVAIKDREHILIEVKSRASKADVSELHKIGLLYERREGVKPKLVIIAGFIDPDTHSLAKRLGVEVIPIITPA